ncbi:DUF202 domain-containing protein [Streptomyces sp. NPDC048717]|uniref:DUF202 domain-containing protein n=1 Tax=Streptomyces sp. NPDC048717 TaxID=3154928 RepID=UPI00341D7EF6
MGPGGPGSAASGPVPEAEPARDPGLQPERTRLAWRRTTLSAAVVALLAARQALRDGASTAGMTAVGLSALAWLGLVAVAHRRIRCLDTARPRPLSHRGALLAAGCAIAFAGFAVAILL